MKLIPLLFLLLLVVSCAGAKDKTFVASTPADNTVRSFLRIPQSDSIDFIRWKLVFKEQDYELQCNYGISKPNTNGFTADGKKITISGSYQKENNSYRLRNGNKHLSCFELNTNLLHIADGNGHLLSGNGGWNYTLNNTEPSRSKNANTISASVFFKDSIIYTGRTPCQVPGVVEAGSTCYKLKWKITLYAALPAADSGRFHIAGTKWRKEGGIAGTWIRTHQKNGESHYHLYYKVKGITLHLLVLDEQVVIFTDKAGNPLVGNEDFSYTLSKY